MKRCLGTFGRVLLREGFMFLSVPWGWTRSDPGPDRPIFIVGSQRSGTRLLEGLLTASPELAPWSEANYVWEPEVYTFWNKNPRRDDKTGFIGSNIHEHELDPGDRPRKRRVRRLFGFFEIVSQKRLLHRNPYNSVRLEVLGDWFPRGRIIHILRDARAVVNSVLNRELHELSDRELARKIIYRWKVCVERARAFRKHDPDRIAEIKYSQLSGPDRHALLRSLYDFCGLSTQNEPWRKGPVVENRNYKWKRQLDAGVRRDVENEVEDPSPDPFGIPE